MPASLSSTRPALLGGTPVRRAPFPRWPVFGPTDERRLVRALRSGAWGKLHGTEVATFERRFAALHGCRHAIGVNVSLRLALMAAGLEAGDEVIVPPYTFYATASAVLEANGVPVFADIERDTFNLDPAAAAAAITPRTRAIIPVHFGGQPADMAAFRKLGRRHGLAIIEDAAHAHGARHRDGPSGSLGLLGSFSFQSSKNLTAGEGGIITTNDDKLAERCVSLHNCGRVPSGAWYEHHILGGNYRLGEFQGAVLNTQLDRLEAQTRRRDRNGRLLAERLARLPGVFPQVRPRECERHSYHLFLLRLDGKEFGVPRAAVIRALQAEGIPCSGGYPLSLHRQPMFRERAFGPYLPGRRDRLDYRKTHCPNSDLICGEQGLWIEQSVFLGSTSDMSDIADAFEKIHQHRAALSAWARRHLPSARRRAT